MDKTKDRSFRDEEQLELSLSCIKGHIYGFDDATGSTVLSWAEWETGTKRQRLAINAQLGYPTCLMCLEKSNTLQGFHFFLWAGELSRAALRGCVFFKRKLIVIC